MSIAMALAPAVLVAVALVGAAGSAMAGGLMAAVAALGDDVLVLKLNGFAVGFCVLHFVLLSKSVLVGPLHYNINLHHDYTFFCLFRDYFLNRFLNCDLALSHLAISLYAGSRGSRILCL